MKKCAIGINAKTEVVECNFVIPVVLKVELAIQIISEGIGSMSRYPLFDFGGDIFLGLSFFMDC